VGEGHASDAGAFAPSFGAAAEPKGGFFSRFRSGGAGKPKKEKAPVEEDEAGDDDE